MEGNKEKIDSVKFDEYKMFINDTARFTDRRQNASNLYITVNSLLLTVIIFIAKDANFMQFWSFIFTVPIIVAGIFVSVWWYQLLRKYRLLIRLRFQAIWEMEEKPDLDGIEKMYHREDELYPRDADGNIVQGKGLNFSDLENKLPVMFIVLYSIALLGVLVAVVIY